MKEVSKYVTLAFMNSYFVFDPKSSEKEFLSWIMQFEIPKDRFDYGKEYKAILGNRDELFSSSIDMEYWCDDFIHLLQKEGESLGLYLMEQITDEEKTLLRDEYEWDGDWQGLLHPRIENTDWGRQKAGPPIAPNFIDGWSTQEQKRLVFLLFIEANKKFLKSKFG